MRRLGIHHWKKMQVVSLCGIAYDIPGGDKVSSLVTTLLVINGY